MYMLMSSYDVLSNKSFMEEMRLEPYNHDLVAPIQPSQCPSMHLTTRIKQNPHQMVIDGALCAQCPDLDTTYPAPNHCTADLLLTLKARVLNRRAGGQTPHKRPAISRQIP